MTSKHRKILAIGAVAALLAGLATYQLSGWARYDGDINRLEIDLARPDALIQTRALAQLPRDLLAVPLLKSVLTEDFVFYYERNEDRLSLSGSLRRLAYEHDLQWQDRLLAWALDEPADVALWRDGKGAIDHYMVSLTRNALAKAIEQAAAIALDDKQLSKAADLRVGGDRVPLLALRYGRDRTLLIASRGNRVVILSDPGMLLSAAGKPDPSAAAVVAKLLSGDDEEQRTFAQALDLPTEASRHRIVLSGRYLSFGYQHFFPALDALRFDFGGERWTSAVRLAGGAGPNPQPTARALPARPAACAWLPMAWPTAEQQRATAPAMPVLPRFSGTTASCWYGQSALHMPLFVAELAADADADADRALGELFAWMVKGKDVETAGRGAQTVRWQRRTQAAHGPHSEEGKTYYLPTLARWQRMVIFSPDDRLVAQAVDTLERRYPSVVDSLPAKDGQRTLAVLTPASLAGLARNAVSTILPRAEEPVLHDAAQTHLPPRLKALEQYPAYRLFLPEQAVAGWQPVEWQALSVQP